MARGGGAPSPARGGRAGAGAYRSLTTTRTQEQSFSMKGAWCPLAWSGPRMWLHRSPPARPAGVRLPHVRLAAGPDAKIKKHIPHNFIQAGRADGAPGGTEHRVGGRTVCTGCKASTHRFRNTALKSVHKVRSLPEKVCKKFLAAQKKSHKVFWAPRKVCTKCKLPKKLCTKCVMSTPFAHCAHWRTLWV